MEILRTERLSVRLWEPGDAPLVKALHGDAEVNRYVMKSVEPWSEAYARQRVASWRKQFQRHGTTKLKLVRRNDETFVGRAGFAPFETGEYELGYMIARDEWGRGYASEAATALIRWFFQSGKADHFIAFAHQDNDRSRRVLERLGMRLERKGEFETMPFCFYRLDKD